MKFEATVTHNFSELTAAQQRTASAVQNVIDKTDAVIQEALSAVNDALRDEENVTLKFAVDFAKVDDSAPAPATPGDPGLDNPVLTDADPALSGSDGSLTTSASVLN